MIVSGIETNPNAFTQVDAVHALLNQAFAYMVGRIDPPSSLTTMTQAEVASKIDTEDFFVLCEDMRPVACMFGHTEGTVYEIGKLAVAPSHQKRGLARALIDVSAAHARTLGHDTLQLYARVELTDNHAVYRALGFTQTDTFTHPGFTQPTALIFQRPL